MRIDNKAWTEDEIKELKRLCKERKDLHEIAKMLGRSYGSVRNAKCRFVPVDKFWTDDKLEELRKMANECVPIMRIAEHFGTSHSSICRRLESIGMKHWHRDHCLCGNDGEEGKREVKTDAFDWRVFSSIDSALDAAMECKGHILTYTLGGHGIGSNEGARVQFCVRTTKDKRTMEELERKEFGRNVVSAEIYGNVMVKREDLILLFRSGENWKGETFIDPKRVKEADDEYYA